MENFPAHEFIRTMATGKGTRRRRDQGSPKLLKTTRTGTIYKRSGNEGREIQFVACPGQTRSIPMDLNGCRQVVRQLASQLTKLFAQRRYCAVVYASERLAFMTMSKKMRARVVKAASALIRRLETEMDYEQSPPSVNHTAAVAADHNDLEMADRDDPKTADHEDSEMADRDVAELGDEHFPPSLTLRGSFGSQALTVPQPAFNEFFISSSGSPVSTVPQPISDKSMNPTNGSQTPKVPQPISDGSITSTAGSEAPTVPQPTCDDSIPATTGSQTRKTPQPAFNESLESMPSSTRTATSTTQPQPPSSLKRGANARRPRSQIPRATLRHDRASAQAQAHATTQTLQSEDHLASQHFTEELKQGLRLSSSGDSGLTEESGDRLLRLWKQEMTTVTADIEFAAQSRAESDKKVAWLGLARDPTMMNRIDDLVIGAENVHDYLWKYKDAHHALFMFRVEGADLCERSEYDTILQLLQAGPDHCASQPLFAAKLRSARSALEKLWALVEVFERRDETRSPATPMLSHGSAAGPASGTQSTSNSGGGMTFPSHHASQLPGSTDDVQPSKGTRPSASKGSQAPCHGPLHSTYITRSSSATHQTGSNSASWFSKLLESAGTENL